MKISVLKENFLKGLSVVSRATSKSFTLPILNNVLFSAEKNFLKLSGTDLELGIKYWVLAKVEKEGSIVIPAKSLLGLISFISDEKISLEVKNNILYLEGKSYKTQIKGLKAEDFPIIPDVESETTIEVGGKTLSQGLSQVVDTASSSQTRPEISGVYFCLDKKIIETAATDSFRLAEKKIVLPKAFSSEKKLSFIVLQKAIREAINVFGDDPGKVKIVSNSNQVMFELGMTETPHPKVQIISRLVEGEYPNYKEIIPDGFKSQLILDKQEFLNQIKAASLFSGKINEIKIKTDPENNIVEIFSQDPDIGQSKSQLKGKIKGERSDISFNHRFLIDGLSNIKSKEVVFELNGEDGPGVLRPVDDENFLYVVMPIKSS